MENAILDSQDFDKQIALSRLHRTIDYAGLRCLSPSEIIDEILNARDEDDRSAYTSRLLEMKLDGSELELLQTAITALASRSEKAPPKARIKLDHAVLRLLRMLPSKLAASFAKPYIGHSRRDTRERAYTALRNKQIPRGMAKELVSAFRCTGDQEALELIARNAKRVPEVDPEFLLANIQEKYWRGRVIEALLVYERSTALALAARYPFEFAHAVGRTGDKTLRVPLHGLLQANCRDLEFLSIFAYALGKIGAKEELQSLRTWIPQAPSFSDLVDLGKGSFRNEM